MCPHFSKLVFPFGHKNRYKKRDNFLDRCSIDEIVVGYADHYLAFAYFVFMELHI